MKLETRGGGETKEHLRCFFFSLFVLVNTVEEDNTVHDMTSRYCRALGRPELVVFEAEVDFFPVIQMTVDLLNTGQRDPRGECGPGFLWKTHFKETQGVRIFFIKK